MLLLRGNSNGSHLQVMLFTGFTTGGEISTTKNVNTNIQMNTKFPLCMDATSPQRSDSINRMETHLQCNQFTHCQSISFTTFLISHLLVNINKHTYCPSICSVCFQHRVLRIWRNIEHLEHTEQNMASSTLVFMVFIRTSMPFIFLALM